MALVGSSVVVGKLLVAHLPVFLISGIRFAIASLILVPLALLAARGVPAIGARDLGVMALQAASGMFAFNALLLAGLALTSAAEGGIVTSTTPAVAAALAAVVLGERWTGRRSAAIGLAVLGILIVTSLAPPRRPADRSRRSATRSCSARWWPRRSFSSAAACWPGGSAPSPWPPASRCWGF